MDKTEQIHRLVSTGKYYFLSRPRRFGKSLLVSTIESYMCGRKDLFNGLALEKLETEWSAYPVLHLDLSGKAYNTETSTAYEPADGYKWQAIEGDATGLKWEVVAAQ